jgi:hypothetical protein
MSSLILEGKGEARRLIFGLGEFVEFSVPHRWRDMRRAHFASASDEEERLRLLVG